MNDHVIVIRSLVLSTGNGVPGSSGVYARLPADWGHRGDSVLVPIPARPMVDGSALGLVLKHGTAIVARAQWTVVGATGKNGVPVQSHVVVDFRGEYGAAAIQRLLMEAETVLDKENRHKTAIKTPVQLMESGAAGQNGPPVPEHVALVRRNVPEHVRTHDQQMEARTVPELQMKLENVATEFAQWMGNGVIGKTGHHVRRRVELEHRNVRARVPSHAQLLAGKTAWVSVGKLSRAKRGLVQLMDSGASGNSGLNAQELVVVEFKHVLARAQDPAPPTVEKIVSGAEMRQGHVVLTLAQWMATGRRGQNGKNVPGLVVVDSTHALEPAPIPLLAMAEKNALGNPMKLVHVTLSLVQWMASGVAGPCGQHAQNHVVQASKREAVLVQVHLHAMEEANVLVKLNRLRVVTLSLVQGALRSLILPSW